MYSVCSRHILGAYGTHISLNLHKLQYGKVFAGGLEQLRDLSNWQVLVDHWSYTMYRLYPWQVLLGDCSYDMQQLSCREVVADGLDGSCKLL